jgi:hypothetical protein
MKALLKISLACALFAPSVLAVSAHAASPWDGTWKVNPAKSKITGTSFTYTKLPNGLWHVEFSNMGYDFAPDGKPYPFLDRSMTTTAQGDHQITFIEMLNGKKMNTTVETLSADGATITDVTSGVHADGSSYTETVVSKRSGTGTGFLGKWVSTKDEDTSQTVLTMSVAADGTLTMTHPIANDSLVAKTDGTPAAVSGPTVPDGFMVAFTKASAVRLNYVVMIKDKKVAEGYQTLAADGKTFTDVSWAIGKMDEKRTVIFEKQ